MLINEWLKNEELGMEIWKNKYQYNNETFDEWLDRVSNKNEEVKQLIKDRKFLFGGRILANRGVDSKSCMSNCFVLPMPEDNIESIFDTAKKSARTFSFSGGVGFDISNLRPNGMKVNNSAKTTTGAVSFMDLYSLTTEIIGQNNRKGALMLTMDCTHPDIEEFIDIKKDLDKVTKANISVKVSDEFMESVIKDENYVLHYETEHGDKIKKEISAKKIFEKICFNNWDMGEPGLLFESQIKKWNLTSGYKDYKITSTNPCGEQPLSENSSCLLCSINLSEFVINPFTDKADFDYEGLKKAIPIIVEAMNEVLDENITRLPLKEQQEMSYNWRQIGIGVMGVADTFIKLGVKYGSGDSIFISEEIGRIFINECVKASALLAKEYGTFPKYDYDSLSESLLYKNIIDDGVKELVYKYGMRNCSLTSIAPCGSIGTMLGTSTGIEPNFRFSYIRKTESLGEKEEKYFEVNSLIKKEYEKVIKNAERLPNYFIESQDIDYLDRIAIQSVWQKYIDTGISSTINLPKEATPKDIMNIYINAWKNGLKGVTVFRDGCRRMGILTTEKHEETQELVRSEWKSCAKDTYYVKRNLSIGCGKLKLFIGYSPKEQAIQDLYIIKCGSGGCTRNLQALAISMSAVLRLGGTLSNLEKAFSGIDPCNSFITARAKGRELSKGSYCGAVILNEVNVFLKELQNTQEVEENISENVCPICGAEVNFTGGCITCQSCGWSKCE